MRREDSAAAFAARTIAVTFALLMGFGAFALFAQADGQNGLAPLEWMRAILILFATSWIAWGAAQSMLGLLPGTRRQGRSAASPIDVAEVSTNEPNVADGEKSRLAILIPICEEDPVAVFARVAAMDQSLEVAGLREQVEFAVLSDTHDKASAERERLWFTRLVRECSGEGRMFYRRRTQRHGRKAGNIGSFITRSGGRYEFALILDADSLMEGSTIAEMLRRMQADPSLGLLQSLPGVIGARSLFGRAMQFASSLYSPIFARGVRRMQGRSGPFWGHNAMIRVRAFAESCGLPELAGAPPFGGHVLSHDYVEAAMLARNGWTVRLDEDLRGSFEEGPDNIVSFARRDRRWCQGNLQHARLLLSPGFTAWSRFVLFQGIFSYLASVLWATFLISSVLAVGTATAPDYFPEPYQLFPVFPDDRTAEIIGLAVGIVGLLVLPKLLIAAQSTMDGRSALHGGSANVFLSTLAELLLSSLTAPILLMYQSRAVIEILRGSDGGWPASQRGEGRLSLLEAWQASGWIALTGAGVLLLVWQLVPGLLIWMLPIGLPMLLAPLIIQLSSLAFHHRLFLADMESSPSPVIHAYRQCLDRWEGNLNVGGESQAELPSHVRA